MYDITNLLPDTKIKTAKRKSKTSVGVMDVYNNSNIMKGAETKVGYKSCLEIIVDMDNSVLATQVCEYIVMYFVHQTKIRIMTKGIKYNNL